jgi:hypothetical protein
MIIGERAFDEITERLAVDFSGLVPFTILIHVLRKYVADHPDDAPALIEAGIRMELNLARQGE